VAPDVTASSAAWPTLSALARALVLREWTSLAVVEECLHRIAELDSGPDGLGAVLALNPQARSQAEAADEHLERTGRQRGPLHGIPILVKDVFETEGIRTTFGCTAFRGYVPEHDADAVRRLRAAGAIVLGKTSTPDLAMSWLSDSSNGSITVNSRSAAHEPGGSSAGSAVAVAAGLVPAALGSDTGGSVRVPASFNGIVGLRPTTGLVSTVGMSSLVAAQDTPGPLTGCVDDAAVLLQVLAGRPTDQSRRPLGDFRLGVLALPREPVAWDGADEVAAVVDATLARLASEGARILDDVVVPELAALLRDSSLYLVTARDDIDAFLASRPQLGSRSFLDLYDAGVFPESLDLAELLATRSRSSARRYAERLSNRHRLRDAVVRVMGNLRLDALVYPTVRVPAPLRDRDRRSLPSRLLPVNTLIASQADLPALTLPAGTTDAGLPVGLELLGRPRADGSLLGLGRAVESALRDE
jgi:Asp-tRNA(Asn)/Glu-tRNA(Gln) amidotransferase A subunit family amidase